MKSRYQWLADALTEGGIVVTASRRLARELRKAHGEMQVASGRQAWPTPDIQFINDWLAQLLESTPADESIPLRIDSHASTVLWEHCVDKTSRERLPASSGIVRQCKQAWKRLQDWCVPLQDVQARASGLEQRQFAAAAQQYCETLSRNNWVDDAGLTNATIKRVSEKSWENSASVAARVCMAGFDRVSPALKMLLEKLANNEFAIAYVDTHSIADTVSTSAYRDQAAQLRAAGAWARAQLSSDPALRVAIICPDLESNASQVVRLVREGLAPGWQISGPKYRNAVDISYGRALADYPGIRIALLLLRWVHDGLKSREISVLLRSRTINGGPTGGRSRVELQLRRIPDRYWSANDLLAVLGTRDADAATESWCQGIGKIADARRHYREPADAPQWAERFDSLLTDVGWPGSGSLDSHEFQLLNRWRDLLNEFARLERVESRLSFSAAVARLSQLANDTLFQPESEQGILPILGSLEAAGMEFDRIWVTSFDARHWPASGKPLAFVSRQLQKEFRMPDATPQDTLAFSQRVLDRLMHSAVDVVLSRAMFEDDVPLRPSPLLAEVDVAGNADEADPGWFASTMLQSKILVAVTDDPVPPVGHDEQIAGGAYTVQRQSSDPFSAFAYGRLRSNELQSFQAGLSARIRGSAIHSALSELYAGRPSHSDLQAWNVEEWTRRIANAARRSLLFYERHADPALRKLIQLEQRRIVKILQRFVAEEKSRESFCVAMVEEQLEYDGHGIRLSLRVDRVDRLPDQGLLIIDYKTGAAKNLFNRAGDLYDLQLMVYALALQEEFSISGIAIFNLDTRTISFKASDPGDKWQEQYSRWSAVANAAIQALARGDARINMRLSTEDARPLNVLSRFEELRRG
jgi:ATP-dependent helicase/nuclease subunit B